jgi:hypothetical protein
VVCRALPFRESHETVTSMLDLSSDHPRQTSAVPTATSATVTNRMVSNTTRGYAPPLSRNIPGPGSPGSPGSPGPGSSSGPAHSKGGDRSRGGASSTGGGTRSKA